MGFRSRAITATTAIVQVAVLTLLPMACRLLALS